MKRVAHRHLHTHANWGNGFDNGETMKLHAVVSKRSIFIVSLCANATAIAENEVVLGDGQIDGTAIEPYQLTWRQCSRQEDQWQHGGDVSEELVVIGDQVLRHRQTTHHPDGVTTRSDTYFDRPSFAPLRMEMEATRDGNRIAYTERRLDAKGYSGFAIKGDNRKELQGTINSTMLHGGALGLPLATMSKQRESVTFRASMVGFDATYDVIAEWTGTETLKFNNQEIEAELVDIEWRHRESGDVYPPGPDASGGRYWLVSNPPTGFPYVPRYKTDTYAVEFVDGICPKITPEH